MTTLTHRYVNPIVDDADPNETGPNEWNDDHQSDHAFVVIGAVPTHLTGARRLAVAGLLTMVDGGAGGLVTLGLANASIDHGSVGGLTDDDHTQYALLAGRVAGQRLVGGTNAGDPLELFATAHASRGTVRVGRPTGSSFGIITIDEANMLMAVAANRTVIGSFSFFASTITLEVNGPLATAHWARIGTIATPAHTGVGDLTAVNYYAVMADMSTGYRVGGAAPTGHFLRGDGTNYVDGTIQAGDLPGGFNGFANPTAQVGLAVINGSAVTAMRSDAAPPINQGITPNWTGQHQWTIAGPTGTFVTFNNQGASPFAIAWGIQQGSNGEFDLTYMGVPLTVLRLTTDGAVKVRGYLRVGSLTAPANTTDGDVTAIRYFGTTVDVVTGYRLGGAAPVGHYLRGNGTNYVDSTIQLADLPAGGGVTFANPTALVGTAAINGVATTAMRSDAAPAINQAMAPTWTGIHIWQTAVQNVIQRYVLTGQANDWGLVLYTGKHLSWDEIGVAQRLFLKAGGGINMPNWVNVGSLAVPTNVGNGDLQAVRGFFTTGATFGGTTVPAEVVHALGNIRLQFSGVISPNTAGRYVDFTDSGPTSIARIYSWDYDATYYGFVFQGWNGSALVNMEFLNPRGLRIGGFIQAGANLTAATNYPLNTTVGDLTAVRATFGTDRTFSGEGGVVQVYGGGAAGAGGQLFVCDSTTMGANVGGVITFGGNYSTGTTFQTSWAAIGGFKINGNVNEFGGYLALMARAHGAGAFTTFAYGYSDLFSVSVRTEINAFTVIGVTNAPSFIPENAAGLGLGVSWNLTGGAGEVDLWNMWNAGGGTGGWYFLSKTGVGTYVTQVTIIGSAGNLLNNGYMRVGSLAAPTNVYAGAFTCAAIYATGSGSVFGGQSISNGSITAEFINNIAYYNISLARTAATTGFWGWGIDTTGAVFFDKIGVARIYSITTAQMAMNVPINMGNYTFGINYTNRGNLGTQTTYGIPVGAGPWGASGFLTVCGP